MKYCSLVILLIYMFSGCKEEETAPVEDVSVLGTWKLDSQLWKSCTKPESNLDEINMCSAATCMTYIFAPDGLFTYELRINNITDVKNGTYSVARDQLTICITGCSIPVTVSRSGNDLTLNYADGATGCLVTRIYKS